MSITTEDDSFEAQSATALEVEIYRVEEKDRADAFLIIPGAPGSALPELATLSTLEMAERLCKTMGWDYTLNL